MYMYRLVFGSVRIIDGLGEEEVMVSLEATKDPRAD